MCENECIGMLDVNTLNIFTKVNGTINIVHDKVLFLGNGKAQFLFVQGATRFAVNAQ